MRRRPDVLLPLEVEILHVASQARAGVDPWVHGFAVARLLRDEADARRLTGHGTLYKALGRLSAVGLLTDRWEDPDTALTEGRPRRRLYRITGDGQQALNTALAAMDVRGGQVEPRIAPA